MSDVSINIRGRDEGLGKQLEDLREKAINLGQELVNVPALWEAATGSQSKRDAVVGAVSPVADAGRQRIIDDYQNLREANATDFAEDKAEHARGSITNKEFNKRSKNFQSSEENLNKQEAAELKQFDKDSNLQLRLIYRMLLEQDRRKKEQSQNDDKEFQGAGYIGGLVNDIKELEKQKVGASQEEIAQINQEIAQKKQELKDAQNAGNETPEGGDRTKNLRGLISTAGAAGSGDLVGTATGAVGLLGGATAAIGAGLIAGIVGFMFNGQKVQESLEGAAAARGFGQTAGGTNRNFEQQLTDNYMQIGALGKSPDEIASMMGDKVKSSKVGGDGLMQRTMDDFAFQKGFGADAGVFSQFERFNKGQSQSTEIALDTLNTLVSIRESSLKEGDLATLGEKLESTSTIMSIQRQKTDSTDSNQALKLLAGFESLGLSKKGEQASGFINRTINGLGEGGSDDIMMLKYQMMAETNPELLNDPAAMQRAMKYKNTDPKYIEHSLKRIKEISGGNQMNYQSLIYEIFGGDLSEHDLDMYTKGGSGKGVWDAKIGGRSNTLTKDQAYSDAGTSVGQMTEFMNQFQGMMQGWFSGIKGIVSPGGNAINVSVTNQPSNTPSLPAGSSGNAVRRGR